MRRYRRNLRVVNCLANGTKRIRAALFGIKSPEIVPNDVREAFRYRAAMLKAIDLCRTSALMKQASRAQGLRCIREFEKINGCAFDPTNRAHLMTVAGMGPYSATFWRVRQLDALRSAPL